MDGTIDIINSRINIELLVGKEDMADPSIIEIGITMKMKRVFRVVLFG